MLQFKHSKSSLSVVPWLQHSQKPPPRHNLMVQTLWTPIAFQVYDKMRGFRAAHTRKAGTRPKDSNFFSDGLTSTTNGCYQLSDICCCCFVFFCVRWLIHDCVWQDPLSYMDLSKEREKILWHQVYLQVMMEGWTHCAINSSCTA